MVDVQKLSKRFVEVAKQEFGIDLKTVNSSIIGNWPDTYHFEFKETNYVYTPIKNFKLNLGHQPMVSQHSILNVHQYFTVNQSGT
jgi:hypothetical protein